MPMHTEPATAIAARIPRRELPASSHTLDAVSAGHKPAALAISYEFIGTGPQRCLLAATRRGICSLQFVDQDDRESLAALSLAFPGAEIRPAPGRAVPVQGLPQFALDRPALHLMGTPFQLRVWAALLHIPPGRTISYQALAEQIGEPRSARAVAGAVAANRIAVLVPCHRVVRSDGSPGGYRWGAARKVQLLEAERATPEHAPRQL
jgi:AraC family transcriptional regulator, regulatory protein of adaptative response / methylated-DNA-[protein]-cysteine methyltransferase